MTVGLRLASLVLALALAGCATMRTGEPDMSADRASADRALARWTTDRLDTFENEAEFRRYMRAARRAARARDLWWAGTRREASDSQEVIVTGSRIPPRNASITNVQEAGVDEGDIVKQIDRFLVVLQDGRLFSVDTGAGPAAALRLADRLNVYRRVPADDNSGTWYDEMLVLGDRIVVTGYSYPQRASEISVFRLAADGRLAREGTFFLSSNDYYDSHNYATRLVDGNLLIYTPVELSQIDPDRPLTWPLIRRWRPQDEADDAPAREAWRRGRRLFDVTAIHRPLFATVEPTVHSVSICPLGPDAAGRDLRCRTTAFIGAPGRQLYVSPTDAFLIIGPGWEDLKGEVDANACTAARPRAEDVYPTHLYRIPVHGAAPGVLGIRGGTFDQFSMQARDGRFRALLRWESMRCDLERYDEVRRPLHFAYLDIPVAAFGPDLAEAGPAAYTALPPIGADTGDTIVDRFTERYLVYGRLGDGRWRDGDPPAATDLGVVPVAGPAAAALLRVPHNVVRAEQAGEHIVLTGYRDAAGLDLSLIDLRAAPRLASTHRFQGRYESEGRSHAFNSLIAADGSGLLALPTVPLAADGERMASWSRPSDMDFLIVDAGGRVRDAGRLETGMRAREWPTGMSTYELDGEPDQDSIPGYSCEVSCVDWYGNSRPIFTDGRLFALLGTELIEGRMEAGRVREVQRLDLALSPPPPR